MLIFGTQSGYNECNTPTPAVCPTCQKKNSFKSYLYKKYGHVFWIPLFAIDKKIIFQCQSCRSVLESKNKVSAADYSVNNPYALNKAQIILLVLAVVILLGLFIGLNYYDTKLDSGKQKSWVFDPKIDDVYEYEPEKSLYSTLKVIAVSGDSIYIQPNKYTVDSPIGIKKISHDSCYSYLTYILSKHELKKMYDKEEIYQVNRK